MRDAFENFEQLVDILLMMLRGRRETDPALASVHGRRTDGGSVNTRFIQRFRPPQRFGGLSQKNGDDLALRTLYIETFRQQSLAEPLRQPLHLEAGFRINLDKTPPPLSRPHASP